KNENFIYSELKSTTVPEQCGCEIIQSLENVDDNYTHNTLYSLPIYHPTIMREIRPDRPQSMDDSLLQHNIKETNSTRVFLKHRENIRGLKASQEMQYSSPVKQ